MTVIDEFTRPSMRETISALMAASERVDMAVANMRIAGLDLHERELVKLKRLRLVMAKLDADALLQTHSRPIEQLRRLRGFAGSGLLEVRAVPRYSWQPDFSVFDHAALVGAHYSELPYPVAGIALTCVIAEPAALRRCARRFEQMWELGYDVLPVVIDTLDELLSEPQCA